MFGLFAAKSEEEKVEDEIRSIESDVEEAYAVQEERDEAARDAMVRKRSWEGFMSNVKAKIAMGVGLFVGYVVLSSLWAKTLILVRMSLWGFLYAALGAFVVGWLFVHLVWPEEG